MKLYLDCYVCILRQTLFACRQAGVDEETQNEIFFRVMKLLQEADAADPPPKIVTQVQKFIREKTGCEDPYYAVKNNSTALALTLYEDMKKLIESARDPFDTAVRLSIAGNIIDFGPSENFDLLSSIQDVLAKPYAIDHVSELKSQIKQAETILYLADNTGETVFDRLLIEQINKPVIYAVKESPILNDATIEDAQTAGLGEVAEIISSGARSPGTVLDYCSEEFLRIYDSADVIIAKGQGNFEALSNENKNIFFLLQTKCEILARDVGVPEKSIVAKGALVK